MDTIDFKIERLLLKSGNALNNTRLDDLKKYNLTPSQSEAILYFANNDKKNIKGLAEHLKITHQAARKLVEKLKDKDIFAVEVSMDDKRSVYVVLTEKGMQLCNELRKCGTSVGELLLDGLKAEEKEQLLKYLEKIEENILAR
jgi:DNA-binding MarR family transcriptional regulator